MKLLSLALLARLAAALSANEGVAQNPVTRVTDLLMHLQKNCEEELEKEKSAFAKFKCWAETLVNTKTASNEQATARKESLEQYVADIEAGKIEFTSERVDLEKEIADLGKDIDTAKALRKQENEDFLAAKAETETAIAALQEAIEALAEGTEGSFLSVGKRARSPESYVALARAVDIGQRFLSKSDALFLDRVISGEVPEHDWKKLNRKATFKMKYEKRSGKILDTLKQLERSFKEQLEEMEAKEKKTDDTYQKLLASKAKQKESAEEALSKMELEGAARGQTKSEAEAEIADLKKQMEADTKFISQTKDDLKAKEGEWADRQQVRQSEIEAISKAIAILRSEDARDTFKKSFKSQGYSLVQVSSRRSIVQRQTGAELALRKAQVASGDMRVAKLVALIGMGADHFAKVIQEIDKVLEILEKEEAADLKTKESCETARSENTRSAVLKARDIDDLSDSISRLESEIEEVAKQIEEKQEEVNKIEEERESAKRLREDEKALWTQSANDDKAAVQLLEQAQTTLEAFYKANAFVQKGKQPRYDNEFVVGAGEAPPPPPKTWEDPYAGKEAESEGIFTILTLLIEDVQADMKKAKEAETEAAEAYEKFDKESSSQITELEGAITTLEGDKSDKEQKVEDDTSSRSTSKDELEAIVKTIKDLQPGCDFQLVNFQTRSAKRAVEKDGLEEAKAVLKGATFKKE
jgi:hypothetical protein